MATLEQFFRHRLAHRADPEKSCVHPVPPLFAARERGPRRGWRKEGRGGRRRGDADRVPPRSQRMQRTGGRVPIVARLNTARE